MRNKFNARKVNIDGFQFDSAAEANRYGELKLLERAGEIERLQVHPRFAIEMNGTKICVVELDFSFFDTAKEMTRYIDVKGVDTALSKLKRKLIKAAYAIEVEVEKGKHS